MQGLVSSDNELMADAMDKNVEKDTAGEEEFISEPIDPEPGSFSTELMARGLAALPGAFTWRARRYEVVECLEHFKETSNEGGSAQGERYLRRQVFHVRLDTGQQAKLYVQRQGRAGGSVKARKQRWFLYSIISISPDKADEAS